MSLRNLSVDVAFYGFLDLLQRSVSLILVPLYTRLLSQADYGRLDLLLVASSIFVVLVDLQFIQGFARLYLEHQKKGTGKRFAGTVLLVRLAGGVGIAALVFVAGTMGFMEWDFIPSFLENRTTWAMVLILVPLSLAYDVLLLQARMLRWKRPFATGALSSVVVSAVLSVFFVAVLGWGIMGVMLGLVLGKVIGVALLLFDLRSQVTWCVDRPVLRPLLAYTLPLVPGWWMGFGAAYVGRFFIFDQYGADANALLAITMKITSAIGLFAVSFRSAWLPLAMSYIGESEGNTFYVRSMRLFMAGTLGSTLVLAGMLHLMLMILVPEGYGAVELYFPLFAVAGLIGECEVNFQLGNQIAKKTAWISAGALVYLVVNLVILITLTAPLGVVAAGIGLAVASLARALVTYISGQRNHHIPYDIRAMVWFGGGCAGLLILGAGLTNPDIPAWSLRVGMLFLGVTLPWLILDRTDRGALRQSGSRWLGRLATKSAGAGEV